MAEQNIVRTACPNCSTSYRLSTSLMDKTVTCKRCGTRFKATPGPPRRAYPLVGKLALRYGLIQQEALESALAHQAAHSAPGARMSLRDIFLEKGFITDQQSKLLQELEKYWQVSQLGKGFCRIALAQKLITKEDAKEAVQAQSARFKKNRTIHRIGDLLVEAEKITPAQRDTVLTLQGRLGSDAATDRGEKPVQAPPAPSPPSTGPSPSEPLAPEAPELIDSEQAAEADDQFELVVGEDGLHAMLRPAGGGAATNTLAYVHGLLTASGITTGMVPDEEITEYLKTDALLGKPLQVARGTPPKPGVDAALTYRYETHQEVGKILAGGKIDYRERGEIPHVKKGDILIEKTPMKPGEPGINIFGSVLSAPPAADVKLRNGSGTTVSEDGLQVIALIDGQPKMTFGGRLSVLSELKIEGDVDLKTGHINFDGHIVVTGCVQPGFRVQGHSLMAREITGAQIQVTGDITVSGGIISADINSQGNIQAKFVKNAKISAFGDIRVTKEITDTTIETSGACRVENGKILASTISAKQGIYSKDVGTDVSSPCRLAAGVDAHIEREIQGIQDAIARRNEKLNQLKARQTAVDIDKQSLEQKIIQLAQVQDRALVEQRDLQEGLERLRSSAPDEALRQAEERISELGQRAKDAEATLTELFDKQEEADRKIADLEAQMAPLRDEIGELSDEKQSIEEWSKAQKPVPVVNVSGPIYVGTIITGVHTQLRLSDTCRHVRIQEVKVTDPDAAAEWEMRISPYRNE